MGAVLRALYEQALLPALGYLALGVPFAVLEWKFPAHRVNVRARLGRDLAACAVVFLNGIGISYLAFQGVIAPLRLPSRFALTEGLPLWVTLLTAPVAIDLSLYWLHRALHTRWLWPLHRWHHSADEIYWLSGIRASFGQNLLYLLVPFVWAIALHVPQALVPVGAAWAVVINHFMHANVRLAVPWLERFVITPRVHLLHHRKLDGSPGNYGAFLAWDRLFGTFVDPDRVLPSKEYGISEPVHPLSLWSGL